MEYGLIGEHLGHSFSKQIHEEIAGYKYEIKEIAKGDLASFMMSKNFKAINVTIPYKEAVIPFLDELSEEAKLVGAVNTIVNNSGHLIGYNTDMKGFMALLKHMNLEVANKNILVTGHGGASKAVIAALKTLKAKNILIASIDKEKDTLSYEDIYDKQEVEIIVNTTPVGMYPNNDASLVELNKFANLEAFVDVIYNPLKSKTVIEALKLGKKAEGGLYMLVAQALYAIEHFLDKKLDESIIDKVYNNILKSKRNIVLIGMPTCGKSTIGKIIAKDLNVPFVDTDEEIIKRIKMPIKDYFALFGEASFRKIETDVIKDLYKQTPTIISTGGGIIKNQINIDLLKQNGIVVFVDRDLSLLKVSDSRPLSSSKNTLEILYKERLPIYKACSDLVITNNGEKFIDAAQKLEELLWRY